MSEARLSGMLAERREHETRAALRPADRPPVPDDRAAAQADPLEALEGRWTLRILCCLNLGEQRFADLRAAIPRVSANILTDRSARWKARGWWNGAISPRPMPARSMR